MDGGCDTKTITGLRRARKYTRNGHDCGPRQHQYAPRRNTRDRRRTNTGARSALPRSLAAGPVQPLVAHTAYRDGGSPARRPTANAVTTGLLWWLPFFYFLLYILSLGLPIFNSVSRYPKNVPWNSEMSRISNFSDWTLKYWLLVWW